MKEVFVLASGPSVKELTDDEKKYLNESNTYAVNDFLIHHKLVGIYPKNWVYIDLNERTEKYLTETCKVADYLNCNWYISKEHVAKLNELKLTPSSPITEILSKYSYRVWGDDISKTLFWCSITGLAINVANLMNPGANIKVIGLDGGRNLYFHSCEAHFKNVTSNHNSNDWFKWGIPIIKQSLNKRGVNIYNCSAKSVYVLNGSMEYSPVIS